MVRIGWVFFLSIQIFHTNSQEGAQYLQSAVKDLRNLNSRQNSRRSNFFSTVGSSHATSTESHFQRRAQSDDNVPPLSLTKGELAALYESAVAKGHTINLDTGDDSYVHAAVHEIDGDESKNHQNFENGPPDHESSSGNADDSTGYYYYYYPIKNFINEMTSQVEHSMSESGSSNGYTYHKPPVYKDHPDMHTTYRPPYQYHSHHHEHNVTIKTQPPEEKKNKGLEPILMAISGFAGMAVMFLLSMIVFPKLGIKPKSKIKDFDKRGKIEDFARFAMEAIEGNCAERFACELSKTARTLNLQDNRFVKLLKRMTPSSFARHIDEFRRYGDDKIICTAIPCAKKKINNNNNHNNNYKRNVNKGNNNNNRKKNNNNKGNNIKKKPGQKKH